MFDIVRIRKIGIEVSNDDEVVIVGGGIGGLGAALALANTGLQVRLLERAPEFSEVGAGLQVGPNAVRALDTLGVLESISELAVFPEFARISDAVTGEELTRLSLQHPMKTRFGYPYLVLHRNDVLTTLLEACISHPLIGLDNNRTVKTIVDAGERVSVTCDNGAEYGAKLVIGADGLNSEVRKLIRIDEPVFSGHIAFRGTIPVEELPGEDRTDDVLLWIGPDIHLMQYPIRRGELYNQVAVFKSRRFVEGRDDWGNVDELHERFAVAGHKVQAALPSVSRARAYPNYDKEPLSTFVSGRVVLIGDAAHPMLQYLGQGACQALEDGLTLANALGGTVAHPYEALARYDAIRVPHTTRCQRTARPWGESWHTDDPIAIAYRNRYFKSRDSSDYSEVEWLYNDRSSREGATK